jgi:hypothetical protein
MSTQRVDGNYRQNRYQDAGKDRIRSRLDHVILGRSLGDNNPGKRIWRRSTDIATAAGLVLSLLGLGAILLLDCSIRSGRGEIEYPYGGADDAS